MILQLSTPGYSYTDLPFPSNSPPLEPQTLVLACLWCCSM